MCTHRRVILTLYKEVYKRTLNTPHLEALQIATRRNMYETDKQLIKSYTQDLVDALIRTNESWFKYCKKPPTIKFNPKVLNIKHK